MASSSSGSDSSEEEDHELSMSSSDGEQAAAQGMDLMGAKGGPKFDTVRPVLPQLPQAAALRQLPPAAAREGTAGPSDSLDYSCLGLA